jgi:hypothetical protein
MAVRADSGGLVTGPNDLSVRPVLRILVPPGHDLVTLLMAVPMGLLAPMVLVFPVVVLRLPIDKELKLLGCRIAAMGMAIVFSRGTGGSRRR